MTSEQPKTGFDVHVSSGLLQKVLPWAIAGVLGASSGGGLSTFLDVSGASRYKESVANRIAENDALQLKVTALEAQNHLLVEMVGRELCLGEN